MVYEDFTTYTEDNGDISKTVTRVTFTTMQRDADACLYKNFGAGYFGNFEFYFTMCFTDAEAGDADSRSWMDFALSDLPGSHVDANNDIFIIEIIQSGSSDDVIRFQLVQRENGVTVDIDVGAARNIGTFYLTLKRAGTAGTLRVYSDAGRTDLLETVSITCNQTTYQYLVPVRSEERINDPADHISGYVEYLDLEPSAVVPPTVTTLSATLVEETTANPRGEVTATGGENPTRYIDYDPDPGSSLTPEFEKSGSNPIWSTADYTWSELASGCGRVLRSPTNGAPVQYDSKYWMVYGVTGAGIGLAHSTDLIDWTDATGNPIITTDDPEAEDWEKLAPHPNNFVYMGDEDGHSYDFWIFYRANDAGGTHTAIGVVKSNNMTTWVRDTAHNPIVNWTPAWLSGSKGVEDFSVQKKSDGNWMALYEADRSPALGPNIGAASTTDTLPHTGWTEEGRVCSTDFEGTFIANPTVIRKDVGGTTYYLSFYEWSGGVEEAEIYGMYAEEADIFIEDAWTQMSNPVVQAEAGWEDNSIIPNGLIFHDYRFYIYYLGDTGVNKQIGLAISSVSYAYTEDCDVGGTGVYNSYLTGLDPDTKYYYRARAVNSGGTDYGSQMDFTTTVGVDAPTVTTQDATGIEKGTPP